MNNLFKNYIFIILFSTLTCISISNIFANDKEISSLKAKLENAVLDDRISILLEIYHLYPSDSSKVALPYLIEAHELSKNGKQKNLWKETAVTLRNHYQSLGIHDLVAQYEKELLDFYSSENDSSQIVNSLMKIGESYYQSENYQKSLEYYLRLAKIPSSNWVKPYLPKVLNNIGLIFRARRNFMEARNYFQFAQNVAIANKNKSEAGNALNNLGGNYYLAGDYENALEFFKQGYSIREEMGDKLLMSKSLNNVALVYNKLNRPELSLRRFHKSLSILLELGADSDLAIIYDNLGDLHLVKNNLDSALYYHQKSLVYAQKLKNKTMMEDAYYSLSETYEKSKDFKSALEAQRMSYLLKDSIFDDLLSHQMTEMQAKYDAENKQIEIESLRQEKEINNLELKNRELLIYTGLAVTAVILALLVALYKRNKIEREANLKLNEQYQEISRQHTEIQTQRDEIEKNHQQIQSSIKYAQRIQSAILPRSEDLVSIMQHIFLIFRPKDVVSGDFYWVHKIENTKVVIVADCTGHGVPGAFMSMIGNELLNEIISINHILIPSKILENLHKGVKRALKQEDSSNRDGMDIAVCVIDTITKKAKFAGAKNPVVYVENGELHVIKGNRNPIGGVQKDSDEPFELHEFEVTDNTMIYLYTDGFQDQFGGKNDKRLGAKRLKELMLSNYMLSMEEQKNTLETILDLWMRGYPQTDDITILGFKPL
jgi:serine phosphatase RsbU (regulator of sigma subunit)